MATTKLPIKVRLTPESYAELYALHEGYGEVQRVIRELIEEYLARRSGLRIVRNAIEATVRDIDGNTTL